MAEYRSIHSGSNIDTAVSSVLNHTCGIQGVKVFGTELSKDSNNKVDVSWSSLVTEGTWTPLLGLDNDAGTSYSFGANDVSYDYNTGFYIRLGQMCYISFHLKCRIVSMPSVSGDVYSHVKGLPFNSYSDGIQEWALPVAELNTNTVNNVSWITDIIDNNFNTMWISQGTNYIRLEKDGGAHRIKFNASSNSGDRLYLAASGWYPIATS